MAVHNYNSWGRTRRPKNITATDGVEVVVTTIATLTGKDIANTASNLTPTNGMYKTENQRFVTIHCSGSSQNVTHVYTYLYATQRWSELMHVNPADGSRSAVVCGDNQSIVVEIAGADVIAFAGNGDPYAAFSTF